MAVKLNKTIKSISYWFVPLLTGLLFITVGIYTLTTPLKSYVLLSFIFSISFVAAGGFEIFFSIQNRKQIKRWGWSLISGILTLAIGILLLIQPEVSIITLPYYVGFVVLFRSIIAMVLSFELKSLGILDWGNLMVAGVLGTLVSLLLLWNPIVAGLTVVIWTAIALITIGILSIYWSIRLRNLKNS